MAFLAKPVTENMRIDRLLLWGAASGFGVVLAVVCVLCKSGNLMDDGNPSARLSAVGSENFIVIAKCNEESSDVVANELRRQGILCNRIGSLMWTVSVRESDLEEASCIIRGIDRRDVLLQKPQKGK